MAAVIKKDAVNRPEKALPEGVDEAWEEYKLARESELPATKSWMHL